MFGEDESESPRVGSPWDSLLSSPSPSSPGTPTTPPGSDNDLHKVYNVVLPKLVPEADAGNVEYKLQLIDPTSERFLRLVTQLKWRLLEGGGQAYYELGVADSGQLVGLTRTNLERSLETLEMMAGEIGASVVVVKEIEVPPSMFEAATRAGKVSTPVAFSKKKERRSSSVTNNGWMSPKQYRTRPTEWGAVEVLTKEASSLSIASESEVTSDGEEPEGPDTKLTVRITSPLELADETSDSGANELGLDDGIFQFDLERATTLQSRCERAEKPKPPSLFDGRYTLPNTPPNKARKEQKIQNHLPNPHKAAQRRAQRDASRAKRISSTENSLADQKAISSSAAHTESLSDGVKEVAKLHAPLAIIVHDDCLTARKPAVVATTTIADVEEVGSRHIVEALVVRKLSSEEAFLDFGGFSLAD